MSLREAKTQLRRALRRIRGQLTSAERRQASAAIAARVLDHACYQQARVVGLYWNVREEVGTGLLCERALADGKAVVLPRVEDGGALTLRSFTDQRALTPSAFGVLEPPREAPLWAPVMVDLFLVPGLGFDGHGGRLGYGRGYYDRLLGAVGPSSALVGLCFECQLVETVPLAGHDVRMHHLATEARWIEVQSAL